jgi:GH15 family glucan-1,4-alpha-glucosidase
MISGAGYYGHDLGGFTGEVSSQPELLERWYEWGALLPLYRSHSRNCAHGTPCDSWSGQQEGREPWKFADPYQSEMRNDIQFRYKLMPYLYTLMYNSTQNGQPMNVPTAFQFSGDQQTTSQNDYDFMVGDYLLASPVYTQGATTRYVYLPYAAGVQWYYWPSGTSSPVYNGGQGVTVSAPLGTLPLFVRSGAIIPMGPTMQYMNQFQPTALDIDCWPAGTSSFTMYEDAGDGWDFTNSTGRAQTTFTSVLGSNTWDFNIAARQGSYDPGSRSFYVYCYTPQNVTTITVNGSPLTNYTSPTDLTNNTQGWMITSDSRLAIKVPSDATSKAIHVNWTGGLIGSALGLPGVWSSWNDTNTPWAMTLVPPPGTPAAGNWYTNLVHVASSGGDITQGTYQFKLREAHNWGENWGLNSAGNATINGTTSLAWNGSTNVAITVSNGYYYSFRALQPTLNSSAALAVLQTSGQPVSLTFSGATPAFPSPTDPVVVSITLSAAKSSEEHIYVRWTTTNWATSSFVEATGSGTAYSATIPAMPLGTSVDYYILSSTATPSTGLTSATADQLTLNIAANNGNNYVYTSANIQWPGFGYPSDPAGNIHHWKEEAVVGNGFMSVMLDQNGSLYDVYFPSVGVRSGSDTANEGYRGPQNWPNCPSLDAEANGQMNLIAAMGGMAVPTSGSNSMYWLQDTDGTDYTDIGQQWDSDNTMVVYTSNRLNVAGSNIKVQQYDFVPPDTALPVITDGTRTNRAVHIKRFLLTNNEVSDKSISFYWDANFNVKGDNAYDQMSFEGTVNGTNYSAMIVSDTSNRVVNGSWCGPDGYGGAAGTEYDAAGSGNWSKSASVYFATVMKLVTNAVTGAGSPCDGSWRDFTTVDNQEGWIGKKVTIPAGQTVELDVMTTGAWDDFSGATGTYTFWSRPMITWFYTNNMATAQAATETYWSNWLSGGVTINFPDPNYDRLFKRSLMVSKLHADPITGGIIAGMHNGAYPFVWPRDGVYASVTFDRTGHTNESTAFYRWLNNAMRLNETWGTNSSYFYQKYTTDGKPVWTSPQVDETASIPWGMYYHYLTTGDGAFLSNNWNLAYTSARASSGDSTNNTTFLNYDAGSHLMWTWNVWEDKTNEHLYSNASVVRGLQDAANIGSFVGSNTWATTFRAKATDITGNSSQGIVKRINDSVEPSDISQLGMVMPFEVFQPTDPLMTNMVERLSGRQTSGGFADDLVEHGGDVDGLVHRYNHQIGGHVDNYWNGGPWFLASSWYGEYFARWQDYFGGTTLIDTNKAILDKLIAKLGPMGLAAEQIAHDSSEQLYPGFWLQTAWPNTWESHSTLVDQMMMFLDYRPEGTNGNNTCYMAPKIPSAWSGLTFNNLNSQGQRFDVAIAENPTNVRADINKHTVGTLNYDIYLRIPAGITPVMVVTNGAYYVPSPSDYDTNTGRVHVHGPLASAAVDNYIVITYGNNSYTGNGISDSWALQYGFNPLDPTVASQYVSGSGFSNLQQYAAGFNPTNPAAYLHVISIAKTNGTDVQVTYLGASGDNTYSPGIASRTNVLEFTTGAADGSYATNNFASTGQTNILSGGTGLGTVTNMTDSGGATNLPSRYYRVRVLLP